MAPLSAPVRRFVPATPVSLPRSDGEVVSAGFPGPGVSSGLRVGPEDPATPSPSTPLCAAQARPARTFGHQKQVAGPKPSRFPRVAGGRPFSADPDGEGARRPSTTSAGPTSPGRLLVYPRRDGLSLHHFRATGTIGALIILKLLIFLDPLREVFPSFSSIRTP
ncbi:protein of unknown function [Pseudorhizobium banfieldiae]|uniref:Uncharacterized protein n=1 Tax=Pseudorhizobium banfieldiae TaxID=1125847 RepID=L0NKR4_9HYPH|nr:protein of unknown function [Pseudorhizobium banfieldiae]